MDTLTHPVRLVPRSLKAVLQWQTILADVALDTFLHSGFVSSALLLLIV